MSLAGTVVLVAADLSTTLPNDAATLARLRVVTLP